MILTIVILGISLVYCQSQGNRTHYPSLKPRPEAALADVKFETTGSGIVTILNPYSRSVSPNTKTLQLQRSLWASMNQIRILYRNFNEAETYDDYIDQIMMTCNLEEATSFDIIWVNASMNGILSKCLLDLYAWDYNIADGHAEAILSNSIVNDRLVTIPSGITQRLYIESSLLSLVSNRLILSQYGFSKPPKSLDELEEICYKILMNEKAMENYKIVCITGAFGSVSEFMSIIVTWLASVNGKIVDGKNVTVASSETGSILERINSWIDNGIISLDGFEQNTVEAMESKFRDGNSVFMFSQLSQLNDLNQNPPFFEYTAYPFPGSESNFVGTLGGWCLGVYKYSRNPTAAIKTIKWMTSEETQKNAILLSTPVLLLPTRPVLYENGEVCNSMGKELCDTFKSITPVLPPWQIAGNKYFNMSTLITSTFKNIIIREIDVNSGLENLYLILKSMFSLDGTFSQIDAPFRPVKKGYTHLTLQVWILSIFCTGSVFLAVGYRFYYVRQYNRESSSLQPPEDGKSTSLIEMNSLKVGKYDFQKLEDEDIDSK